MTTYDYYETRPSLAHGHKDTLHITMIFLVLGFFFGFMVSEMTEKNSSYTSPSIYYNTTETIEDWHGNVMRSQPQILSNR